MSLPSPLPDDPRKWDGWSYYNSSNYYERLCIDPFSNPSDALIEENSRQILVWWQKKLPLKNQPSNPLAQLLRSGLDTAPKYISEARSELLDPKRRAEIDAELREKRQGIARDELNKFLAFALSDRILTVEEEESLVKLGREHGLALDDIENVISIAVEATASQRYSVNPPPPPPQPVAPPPPEPDPISKRVTPLIPRRSKAQSEDPAEQFLQMLQMARLTMEQLDDRRDTFIEMAENLGLEEDEANDLLDEYANNLEEEEEAPPPPPRKVTNRIGSQSVRPGQAPLRPGQPGRVTSNIPGAPAQKTVMTLAEERERFRSYANAVGGQMLFVPSGSYMMGSSQPDAAPNEQPLTKVTIGRFYISRHPITNKQYEQCDASHKTKRAPWADDNHPVVYVSYLEATKFCQWLSSREKKKYRLPTEAEWEYAARGTDGRKFPWGNEGGRPDLANFADARTKFAWSDPNLDDGYAETSPVGAFTKGSSPFGVEDMAGNVFEWCSDWFEDYKGGEKKDPKGPLNGSRRVYRGGSWRSKFSSIRATARNSNIPSYAYNDVGFRIVCETEE